MIGSNWWGHWLKVDALHLSRIYSFILVAFSSEGKKGNLSGFPGGNLRLGHPQGATNVFSGTILVLNFGWVGLIGSFDELIEIGATWLVAPICGKEGGIIPS